MNYGVGTLVRARGREWVVLPESRGDLLMLRPLGGSDDEVAGVYLPLEGQAVEPARFSPPDPALVGDHRSCRLLRDAVRLGFRSSTGPFRSFAGLAVEPRPYQLVPLLMALKLDPVRLLIADDVGIGKTVEALLVAKELLERGEADGLTVLCPPHLAEQWQTELKDKFHLEAELVLPGTVARLERDCFGMSVFERYPYTVVSTDYIKADRRRDDFLRACRNLVIVDEAHTCVDAGTRSQHQRHRLVKGLAEDAGRHLVLVTATPHSGKEDAFRQLLALLDRSFALLPEDLSGKENEQHRRALAEHFVQRRRGDIRTYLDTQTPFPEREDAEETYRLSGPYREFFDRVLAYARETVRDETGGQHRQRIRWWSALALLRTVSSSPAAAAATMRNRVAGLELSPEEADCLGRRTILDLAEDDGSEGDVAPGGDASEALAEEKKARTRLSAMAREAEALRGDGDQKLVHAVGRIKAMLKEGYRPILFCRFIQTAEYVAEELRARLPRSVEVTAVTGLLPPPEREARVRALGEHERRVLVCTDCLSEGINLQEHFDAVIHYDLSWNPTRHEQREGRVDRFGQPRPRVRVLTYYGENNPVDGLVLEVLLRKHKTIRSSLGISVPVPADPNAVVEALMEGLLFRGGPKESGEQLLFDFADQRDKLHLQWEQASAREKRSQTMFAQRTISVDEVARELEETTKAIGSGVDVARFVEEAVRLHGGTAARKNGSLRLGLTGCPRALLDVVGGPSELTGGFALPVGDGEVYLSRTHPLVEGLATFVTDTALDPLAAGVARRSGAIRTRQVTVRTTLLLVRLRCHIERSGVGKESRLLAEECRLVAFEGSPQDPRWLDDGHAEALLEAVPSSDVPTPQRSAFVSRVVEGLQALEPHLADFAQRRGEALLASHARVRSAGRQKGVRYGVHPQLPVDVLGIFVYLPETA